MLTYVMTHFPVVALTQGCISSENWFTNSPELRQTHNYNLPSLMGKIYPLSRYKYLV